MKREQEQNSEAETAMAAAKQVLEIEELEPRLHAWNKTPRPHDHQLNNLGAATSTRARFAHARRVTNEV